VPALGIADDRVDRELVDRPQRWNITFIRRYMVEFGLESALFDLATFGILLFVFRAGSDVFRTGWFVESLLTELGVALVMRTRRRWYRSRPGVFAGATDRGSDGLGCRHAVSAGGPRVRAGAAAGAPAHHDCGHRHDLRNGY
jgi:hypothetical protein